jgi:cell division protein ZapA (FtsZ GTPase activity inhibitor)
MTDEIPKQPVIEEEVKPNYEDIAIAIHKELQEYKFLSDQVKFNATLFQGSTLILDKLVKLDERLGKIEEKLNEKTKQTISG